MQNIGLIFIALQSNPRVTRSILTFDYLAFNMKRLEVPLKGLNVHLRTTGVWPLLLKGLSKLIRQNLHLELIGCIHLENWGEAEDETFLL